MFRKTNSFYLDNRLYWGIFFLFTIFYVRGLFSAVYGVDASIYASLSAEMKNSSDWLQLSHKGKDYLDKPPLHFWLSALSFKLIGVSSFAYKLPSYLFTLIGVYSTFKLGKLLYNEQVGKLASLLFYTCFSTLLINLDVRTDTILVGIVVFSIWNLVNYLQHNNYWSFTLGFIAIGFAMLAKGPIGLMVPVLALGVHFLIKKEWKNIFKWQWLLGLVIVGLVISPMLLGLYNQFDAQPEKITSLSSGMKVKGVSGLKFYFWDQSFGRISGGNKEWKNDAGYFFFTHTFLWSFLPWAILGILGFFAKLKQSVSSIKTHEFYTLGAIILPFIAMSLSQYKLPHYIYVFFPLWFILAGWWYVSLSPKSAINKAINYFHYFLQICFIAVSLLVCTYIFSTSSVVIWIVFILLTIGWLLSLLKMKGKPKLITSTALSFALVMFVFSFHFIPTLISYDGSISAAKKSIELKTNRVFSNDINGLAFDMYGNSNIIINRDLFSLHEFEDDNNYIFVKDKDLEAMKNSYRIKAIHEFDYHAPTQITISFLNPTTRESTISRYYLLEI